MTDAELLAAQHRVIVNMTGCTCNMEWKHSAPQPPCQKCQIVQAYCDHRLTSPTCVHGIALGHDCSMCPRGIAQVWTRIA